jgi:hypothetical protein
MPILDRTPAGDSTESLYARVETATDAWFARTETSLRGSARGLWFVLILFSVTISIAVCFVFSSVGVGIWDVRIQSDRMISPAQATATYGAEQFHIQLTAQAEEAQRPSP